MDLTSAECIEAAKLYRPSALSEAEMNKFLGAAGGTAIPKKPRKKSRTLTKQVDEGGVGKEVVLVEEEESRLELKRKSREERGALQKKKKVVEEEERGIEVPQFIPRPPPIELDPELRESEEGAEVRAPGKGKGLVPPLSFQSSLFEVKNMMGARRFINSTFPEVDKRHARDKALRYCAASVVKHVLEEFMDSVKEHSLLQRQCDQLQKENEELEKKNKELQEALDEAKEITLMNDAFMELKENVQMLVHNGMKEHINNFISSNSFDNIITFGEQEERVEENGESMLADFRPQIKLRWDHDVDGRTVFPPKFDFKFLAVEEEGAEVEEDEVEARVEGAEQPTQPPLPAEYEPVEPPPPTEK
ncbi:hypothetical protein SLEP1_g24394 [Rubroshorea leprosula]|uniref:Uncharacterized protein n=1 Tax=Rubroshorea leprosula TaxID=152421 RepID=A0AAV5JFU7_9ROSI|nr:hypothetical protein SLEP1_g24394 [Rubroshorea leprosula]